MAVTCVALQAVIVAAVVPKRTVPVAAEVGAADGDAAAGEAAGGRERAEHGRRRGGGVDRVREHVAGAGAGAAGVTVTLTLPGLRLVGTVAVTELVLQAVTVAAVVPKRTVPVVAPRFEPAMTTLEPVRPWFGVRVAIAAAGAGTVML